MPLWPMEECAVKFLLCLISCNLIISIFCYLVMIQTPPSGSNCSNECTGFVWFSNNLVDNETNQSSRFYDCFVSCFLFLFVPNFLCHLHLLFFIHSASANVSDFICVLLEISPPGSWLFFIFIVDIIFTTALSQPTLNLLFSSLTFFCLVLFYLSWLTFSFFSLFYYPCMNLAEISTTNSSAAEAYQAEIL